MAKRSLRTDPRVSAWTPERWAWMLGWAMVIGLGTVVVQATVVSVGTTPGEYPAVRPLLHKAVGRAAVERLGPVYLDGAGPLVSTMAGDWRLSNEHIVATFASVEDPPTTGSFPLGGFRDVIRIDNRKPGALIDLAVDGNEVDFLGYFTQGVGLDPEGSTVVYDTIEPVVNEREVGLRMEGSPFETAPLRLQTTYWLGEGDRRLRIESRLVGLRPGDPVPEICDVADWGPAVGRIFAFPFGRIALPDPTGVRMRWYQIDGEGIAVGVAPLQGGTRGVIQGLLTPLTRVSCLPWDVPDERTTPTLHTTFPPPTWRSNGATFNLATRAIWIANGHLNDVTRVMHADLFTTPTARVQGTVRLGTSNDPAPGTPVVAYRMQVEEYTIRNVRTGIEYPQQRILDIPKVLTATETDDQGRYELELPHGYYMILASRSSGNELVTGGLARIVKLDGSAPLVRHDMRTGQLGRLKVRVVDRATSRPLAAKLRLTPADTGTPPVFATPPVKARQYLDTAYVPPEGTELLLPQGDYIVYGTCGIHYDRAQASVTLKAEQTAELTLALELSNPTPGWHGIELGARTRATPGCAVSLEDMVLMAAAEGLDWIVSGDFERLTDFGPAIERLGLQGLGHSLGFRTALPAHPEWGQFLVFPVPPGAPDPAVARREWQDATTARDFIRTLRRLYPGALIQSELPYTAGGQGYFGDGKRNPYEISYEPKPDLDLSIDAVRLIPPRSSFVPLERLGFWMNHLIGGRRYLISTSADGRLVFGAEPGYPRMLVHTGVERVEDLNEARLFDAVRNGKIQITNGPFIDYAIEDKGPGELIARNETAQLRLRVTAPNWADLTSLSIDKEGMGQRIVTLPHITNNPQRYPDPSEGDPYARIPLRQLSIMDFKDTLLSVMVAGENTLDAVIPLDPRSYVVTRPFAVVFPIVIDANGNGRYDPLESYRDKGR